MTVDTATVPENKKNNHSITKRDRRDVIRQVREITGLDDHSINQTIEACKDDTGRYSLEQVISLLFDENLQNNLQRTQPSATNNPNPSASANAGVSYERNNGEPITDDVIEISPDLDQQQVADDDLERALELSRESMDQIIDEFDIAKRNSLDEPVGLKNIGNTCWFNSIVQSLYTLPYFRQLILNFQSTGLNRILSPSEQQAIFFIEELRHLFLLMLKSPRCSINPDRAIKKFKNTRKLSGVDFSHEDCSEFATHLIDLVELAYETMGKSLMSNGNLRSFLNPVNTCVTGEVTVERNGQNSIREALRQINIQMIDSSNLYDGLENLWLGSADESLINQQSIVEQRWLTRLPPVLFICLNRYRFSPTTKQASKILAPFEFYPDIYLDRYMLINKPLILNKRNLARTLYTQLHDLEKTLNSYLKYPCNGESFSLANAIRIVYEYATGCRLNPILPRRSMDSISNRSRTQPFVPIQPSQITSEELQMIQNTLPTWLTEIELKCSGIREQIQRLQNELKLLYNDNQLQKARYSLHAVCVHEGSATLGHFWTYVYHTDRQKWYRYNDNEVTESKWEDVFADGIGGDSQEQRVPSAYLLVYINNEQRSLSNDIHYELTEDLQRILDEDLTLLQEQIEIVRLEQLYNELKVQCERLEKSQPMNKILTLSFFTGPNAAFETEIVRPVIESTITLLKTYEKQVLTSELDRLLDEIINKVIVDYTLSANQVTSSLPHKDHRLQHILSYCSTNRIHKIYRQRVMFDIIRLLPISTDDIRLRILKLEAEIISHKFQMASEQIQEYQKILNDYKDYRAVIAAFLAGYQLLNDNKFEEAITYFCVACEFNLRLSKQCTSLMRAMDSCLLFKSRRLCFERWNEAVINRFKKEPNYRLDAMKNHFLPCLMQLRLSSEDDQVYINEIQRIWCSLLDKFEGTERSTFLGDFVQRLLEPPLDPHYHSVSINKHQLIERYEEAVRDIIHRYPSANIFPKEQQPLPPTRSNRTSNLITSHQIPVVIQQQTPLVLPRPLQQSNRSDPRGSSPMQQDNEDQGSLPPPSSI